MKRSKRARRMKRMRRLVWTLAAAAFLLLAGQGGARCGEIDLLVDKLVEKDVLNPNEAKLLLAETRSEVAKQNAQGKNDAVPGWVQTLKFKGDLRLRYQQEELDSTSGATTTTTKRERGRIRLRVGADALVAKDWHVGFGLASGSSDPRSTNQTMQDNFTSKSVLIDYMYGKHKLANGVNILGGKMKLSDTLWLTDDLLWDSDVNPEGVVVAAKLPGAMRGVDLFLNTGWFLIDEISGGRGNADPSMTYIQPGAIIEINEGLTLKGAANAYFFNGLQRYTYAFINNGGKTNTRDGQYIKYDYDSYGLTAELGYALPEETSALIKYYGIFADYLTNPDPDEENRAFLIGGKFGHKKVSSKGSWQFKAQYRELQKDAWVDFLADSDVIEGITDAKGVELIYEYALAKNVTLGIDYYMSETMKATTRKEQNLLQVDCILKF